ncbi:MAG: metallopeptidase TldD-related protein [Candidatus Atribacteria bacterium]|nr:metallopeptidase TldD-related protein [Candidatus Atribacteria bacterium]
MGEEPTGNARALNYCFKPIVRMTNTYIENGDVPFKDLLSGIKKGIYAKDCYGGMTWVQVANATLNFGIIYQIPKERSCI